MGFSFLKKKGKNKLSDSDLSSAVNNANNNSNNNDENLNNSNLANPFENANEEPVNSNTNNNPFDTEPVNPFEDTTSNSPQVPIPNNPFKENTSTENNAQPSNTNVQEPINPFENNNQEQNTKEALVNPFEDNNQNKSIEPENPFKDSVEPTLSNPFENTTNIQENTTNPFENVNLENDKKEVFQENNLTTKTPNPFEDNTNIQNNNPIITQKLEAKELPQQDLSDKNIKETTIPNKQEENRKLDLADIQKDKDYLDEVLKNDLDLDSEEIEFALEKKYDFSEEKRVKKKAPKPKIINDNDIINIDIGDSQVDVNKHNVFKNDTIINNKKEDTMEKTVEDKESLKKLEKPQEPKVSKKIESNILPDFKEEKKEEEKNKRNKIMGDLFVKSTLYKEVLHSNLVVKEDIKICDDKMTTLNQNISSQKKQCEKLKKCFEEIQEGLMSIDDKLFNNNEFMR